MYDQSQSASCLGDSVARDQHVIIGWTLARSTDTVMFVLTQSYPCDTWFVCSTLWELAVSNLGQLLFYLSITWSRCRNAYWNLWLKTSSSKWRRFRLGIKCNLLCNVLVWTPHRTNDFAKKLWTIRWLCVGLCWQQYKCYLPRLPRRGSPGRVGIIWSGVLDLLRTVAAPVTPSETRHGCMTQRRHIPVGNTVFSRYITVIFLCITHKKHPTGRP